MLNSKRTALALAMASLLYPAVAAAADTPELLTQRLIDALASYSVRSTCSDLTGARQARETVIRSLDSATRWRRALQEHERHFSPEQLQRLVTSLAKISERETFPRLVRTFDFLPYRVRRGAADGTGVHVRVEPISCGEPFVFHWRRASGRWQLYDVTHLSSSLLGEHEAQLGRLIERYGAAALLKRVGERLDRLPGSPDLDICLTAR